MILLIDNYDSFSYNLARYFVQLQQDVHIFRNDEITINDIKKLNPKAIILSPGPCTPNEAGICLNIIKEFSGIIPILGICLGHQTIAQFFGTKIIRSFPQHGIASDIYHKGQGLFTNIPSPFKAARYHSLIADNVQKPLFINAYTGNNIPMSIQHETHHTYGLQFHPESILTEHGYTLLQNFLDIIK